MTAEIADYAFAPRVKNAKGKNDPFVAAALRYFDNRPATRVIRASTDNSLQWCLRHLASSGSIKRPVRNLLVASHASERGTLSIDLFPGMPSETVTYEMLERAISDSSASIRIPAGVFRRDPGDPTSPAVHIKACSIGKSLPFMHKLKEALGDEVQVSAPKYIYAITRPIPGIGILEGMLYDFVVTRNPDKRFKKRNDLYQAFQDKEFPLVNDHSVPPGHWKWLIQGRLRRGNTRYYRVGLSGIQLPNGRRTVPLKATYRIGKRTFVYTIQVPEDRRRVHKLGIGPFDQMLLAETLRHDPAFSSDHPWPMWQREGFQGIDDFIDGYEWNYAFDGIQMVCTGTLIAYSVRVHVVDPDTVAPDAFFGKGKRYVNSHRYWIDDVVPSTTTMRENDPKFFTML